MKRRGGQAPAVRYERFVLRVFSCAAYRAELTPSACSARHLQARKAVLRPGEKRLDDGGACTDCRIGRAHTKGRELDGVSYRDREEEGSR